jgi:hypothetical protein
MGRVLLTFQRLRRERLPGWDRKSSHRCGYVRCSFSPRSFQTGARSAPSICGMLAPAHRG